MEMNQQQMFESKENDRAKALKKQNRLLKKFVYTAVMLKGSLADGWRKS